MAEITAKSGEQRDAEAGVDDFRKQLGPFVVAAEKTRMAMVFTEPAGRTTRSSSPMRRSSR